MERYQHIPPEILEPLTQKDLESIETGISKLIYREKRKPGNIGFRIMWRTPEVISIGLSGEPYGFWIFDANSQTEIKEEKLNGLVIVENPTDMVLSSQTASISEVNANLPRFLVEYYPELAKALPLQRQKVTDQKTNRQNQKPSLLKSIAS